MIDLLPNDEQQAIWDSAAQVLAAESPLSRLHGPADGDAALLRRAAGLGWIGLGLAETDGGVGYGPAEEVLLFRAAGRHLAGPGLLGSVLAARIATRAGDVELAAALLSGARRAAVMIAAPGEVVGRAVSGLFHRFDARPGDLTVVWGEDGAGLFDRDLPSTPIDGIDEAVTLERLSLETVGLSHWVTTGDDAIAWRATVLIAALLTGLSEAARDLTVDYAKLRQQFGQPIGAFQAIKHACADMAVRCEAAWSLTVFAALSSGRMDSAFQAHAAWIIAAQAAERNAACAVQTHGGIGFTAECDAQLFVKRAQLLIGLGGGVRSHKSLLLARPDPALERAT